VWFAWTASFPGGVGAITNAHCGWSAARGRHSPLPRRDIQLQPHAPGDLLASWRRGGVAEGVGSSPVTALPSLRRRRRLVCRLCRPCRARLPCDAPDRPPCSTQLRSYEPRGAMSCGSPMPRGERIAKPAEQATRSAGLFFEAWRRSASVVRAMVLSKLGPLARPRC